MRVNDRFASTPFLLPQFFCSAKLTVVKTISIVEYGLAEIFWLIASLVGFMIPPRLV
jgi:hypothetical protein